MLVPTKADLTAKEQSYKQDAIGAKDTGGIDMILALLAEMVTFHIGLSIVEIGEPSLQVAFLAACEFWTTILTLEKQIYAEFCDLLQVFVGVLCGSGGENWRTYITWCYWSFLFGEVSKLI